MNKSSTYIKKCSVIQSINGPDIQKPKNIPIDVYLQEAEDLHHWCQDDLPMLSARGLDPALVEELPVRCSVLREAQARWISLRQGRGPMELEWKECAARARALKKELTRTLRFAFRGHADLLASINISTKGQGHADMVQALNDLAVLGKEHAELLDAVHADPGLADAAAQTAAEAARMLAAATTEKVREHGQALKIRNQAYTWLKEAVDAVQRCGRFVFADDKKRVRGYRSEYVRKLRKPRKGKEKKVDGGEGECEPEFQESSQ